MEELTCKKCGKTKRKTQFSQISYEEKTRDDTCRACNKEGSLTAQDKYLILREAYRHYLEFKDFITGVQDETGDLTKDVIEYAVPKESGSDEYVKISISFTDLSGALKRFADGSKADGTVLSKRKEQAFFLNVIRDMRQDDVAQIMGIRTVTVGQYVKQSCLQLCKYYYGEDFDEEDALESVQSQDG